MPVALYSLFAVALAALAPLALIVTRTELRKARQHVINDLRCLIFDEKTKLPQITLVEARYVEDGKAARPRAGRLIGTGAQGVLKLWTGAFVFFLVCLGGFALLLTPRTLLLADGPEFPRLTYALLWTVDPATPPALAQVLTIAGSAFLGGYVFQIRYLIRATLNQELSALAFVRASINIVQGAIISIVLFRVAGESMAFPLAIGLAFLIGYWPDLGLNRIARLLRVQAKFVDGELLKEARITPLEIIDGIDPETAFRLQENNLFDVQNLATANPIKLYVETPFGLLEVLDWVLQAQLCENAGPRTFLDLKAIGIRTVFDLERAALACNAPPDYVAWLGTILFRHGEERFARRFGASVDAPGAAIAITAQHVRHAVAIMLDDLHIHQLRALWRIMMQRTMNGDGRWLHPTGPLPGESDLSACVRARQAQTA